MRLPTPRGQRGIQAGSAWSRWAVLALVAVACAASLAVPMRAADQIEVAVDLSKPGATIHRNIFGQFAEHLGTGIYEDAPFLPVAYDAWWYTKGSIALPRVDAIAAKDGAGTLWLALINVDPNRPANIAVRLTGAQAVTASGETLTARAVDSVNTFEAPNAVTPKPITTKVEGGRLVLTLEPKSVTVVSVR